ncbi:hypothetical protein V6N13_134023 [Hibiscus sabdariffa]
MSFPTEDVYSCWRTSVLSGGSVNCPSTMTLEDSCSPFLSRILFRLFVFLCMWSVCGESCLWVSDPTSAYVPVGELLDGLAFQLLFSPSNFDDVQFDTRLFWTSYLHSSYCFDPMVPQNDIQLKRFMLLSSS